MKKILLIIFFSSAMGISASYAQQVSDSIPVISRISTKLQETHDEQLKTLAESFQTSWIDGSLNETQKSLIEKIFHQFEEKQFSVRPYFADLVGAVQGGLKVQQLPPEVLRDFLDIVSKATDQFTPQELARLLNTSNTLLAKQNLYDNKLYRLQVQDAAITFSWDEPKVETVPETKTETAPRQKSEDAWGSQQNSGSGWGNDSQSQSQNDGWGNDTQNQSQDNAWGDEGNSGQDKASANPAPSDSKPEENGTISALMNANPAPELTGPVVHIQHATLQFISSYDSLAITQVEGAMALNGNTFVAKDGHLTWETVGLSPDSVYAQLNTFFFDVSTPKFSAEQAVMTDKGYLKEPVKGIVTYQSEKAKPKNKHFPQFNSYTNNIKVKNLGDPQLIYRGGFSREGRRISSKNVIDGASSLELQSSTARKFSARSHNLVFGDSLITADLAAVSIYQKTDSLYHPGLKLRYNTKSRQLTLLKQKGTFDKAPFSASYYNMNITADRVEWDVDSDSLNISTMLARNRIPAVFESEEYFNMYRFNSLAGLYQFHPLQMVAAYANKVRSNNFYADDMAKTFKQNPEIIKGAMKLLWTNGFIDYQPRSGYIKILPKTWHYIRSRWGKKDYDNVLINSTISGPPNATLNFKTNDLTVRGVKDFNVNDKLGVKVEPDSGIVVIKKNRDVEFNGKVFAGNYEYQGKDFYMDYDSFKIDLPQIDKIKFNISRKKGQRNDNFNKEKLQNQLVNTAGVLYINKPDNKSAQKFYPNYPIFNATQEATVYFVGQEINGGVYGKELYFKIPPFTIDSVSSSDPKSIGFEGTFHSGGIFPVFHEKLRIMPDNSLGFKHPLPPEGLPLYGGEGKLYGSLSLDNQGLQGSDKVEYLNTTLNAPYFTFYQDSAVSHGSRAVTVAGEKNGVSFPDFEVDNYNLLWLPLKDSMYIENRDKPIAFYNGSATLDGAANITAKGTFGEGTLKTRGSISKSEEFHFKQFEYDARHANFSIESSDPEKPALASDNVKLKFNLTESVADISPETEGTAALNFPYAQYKTSIPNATWNLNNRKVYMKKPSSVSVGKSYFYSTRADQDSLAFNATEAEYNIDSLVMKVSGIPFIKVADAKIIPDQNRVLIKENANLQDLHNADLVIDTLTGYHHLFDGNIQIESRKKFTGNAVYRYVNTMKDTFNIYMDSFRLEPMPVVAPGDVRTSRTVANGRVTEDSRFVVSPNIYFKGNVTMYANKKALQLDGFVKPNLQNIPNFDTWIAYKSESENQEVVFDFDKAVTEMGNSLEAGLHFESGTNQLYATFLTDKKTPADEDFFRPSGLLFFDQDQQSFVIESPGKKKGEALAGKVFTYNEKTGQIHLEGPMQFVKPATEDVQIRMAGTADGNLNNNQFDFNTMLVSEFGIPTGAVELMGQDMQQVIQRLVLPEASDDVEKLLPKLAEFVGDAKAKQYKEQLFQNYMPLNELGKPLRSTLVLTDLPLKWDAKNTSWYSSGKIGISNVGPIDLNASIDGFVEIQKKLEGESITLFLQVSPTCWYYFNYQNNQLVFFSSNKKVNEIVADKSKAGKAKYGKFVFLTGDLKEATDFVERFRKTYYNIDAPYYLQMATDDELMAQPVDQGTPAPAKKKKNTNEDDNEGF